MLRRECWEEPLEWCTASRLVVRPEVTTLTNCRDESRVLSGVPVNEVMVNAELGIAALKSHLIGPRHKGHSGERLSEQDGGKSAEY